jgi:hypothetical protein
MIHREQGADIPPTEAALPSLRRRRQIAPRSSG